MKPFLAFVLIVALASCSKNETDSLRDENARLKTELETVTRERDGYKAQIDQIRAALENPSSPDASLPDSNLNPPVAPPDTATPAPATPNTATPDATTPPSSVTPPDSSSPAPLPENTAPAPTSSEAVTKLKSYAENVLSAAQNYKAQNSKEPPTECADGYTAGDYKVEDADNIVQACTLTIQGDGSYTVQVRDSSGNSVTAP
jgi:hypothetical protein